MWPILFRGAWVMNLLRFLWLLIPFLAMVMWLWARANCGRFAIVRFLNMPQLTVDRRAVVWTAPLVSGLYIIRLVLVFISIVFPCGHTFTTPVTPAEATVMNLPGASCLAVMLRAYSTGS